jgi:hypothetical protein
MSDCVQAVTLLYNLDGSFYYVSSHSGLLEAVKVGDILWMYLHAVPFEPPIASGKLKTAGFIDRRSHITT